MAKICGSRGSGTNFTGNLHIPVVCPVLESYLVSFSVLNKTMNLKIRVLIKAYLLVPDISNFKVLALNRRGDRTFKKLLYSASRDGHCCWSDAVHSLRYEAETVSLN